jgi:two-component system sensor histidine kinase UhpB
MRKTILALTACSLLYVGLRAQENWFDSVKRVAAIERNDTNKAKTLINLCDAYAFSYPDTAFAYGKLAYELSEKLDYDRGRLYSIISINSALYAMSNYPLELEYAFKLIPLSKRMDDINAKGFSFGAVGDSYMNIGEYAVALKYYREVLKIGIREKLPELHRMYTGLTAVFVGMKLYDSALLYAKTGYQLFKASPYYTANNWDTWWSESNVYNSLASVFAEEGSNDSAIFYYRKSVVASKAVQMKYNELYSYAGMAAVFKQQGRFDSARFYAQRILAEKSKAIYPIGKQKAAEIMAGIYEEEHKGDSALKYLHIAIQLKDSLYNQSKIMAFQDILAKQNEKDRAVAVATSELKTRYQLYFIIFGLVIVFIVATIAIRNRKQRQLQTIRNSIADDLHDDIGSTLSSISIINELAKAKSPEALLLLNSIGESTAAIQENMSDIVWAVNPKNDHFENIVVRMNLFATEILDATKIQLQFNSDDALKSARLSMGQRKNLYLFFKEAINNATKYSNAKKVWVEICKKDQHIEMSIMDDGKGFEHSGCVTGNGMDSLKKRAEELNGVYQISSQIDKGTSVRLKFKIS